VTGIEGAPYLDAALPVEQRVDDLLARMTLAEKAGQLFQTMTLIGEGGSLDVDNPMFPVPAARDLVVERHMTHVNVLASPPTAREFALWHNNLQELAASTRLGIPVTVASDPRHSFTDNPAAALMSGPFSQWPETLGLAATRDPELMETFADVCRQEYLAVGIRTALHPQIDLATEPRWARASGTFGEDADLTAALGVAYVRGLQGTGDRGRAAGLDAYGAASVSAMCKHFPGGGPQKDGEDPHFAYGREQIYPGGRFADHLKPFEAVIAAGARQMMPYYGMPVGLVVDGEPVEEVGFGFNRAMLTTLLREKLGFDGIICTDWGLVTDAEVMGQHFPARAWGVEHLTPIERVAKILDAGADQLGGEACPELVVELVASGRISEARIDVSVRRLLTEKFVLGLFDEGRFLDVDAAASVVGRADFRAAGHAAQVASITVLKADRLPLASGLKVYVEGMDAAAFAGRAQTVATPAEADIAILRLKAPFEQRGNGFEAFFHAGSLAFEEAELARITAVCAVVPTIVDVYLDRPAILTEVADAAVSLVVNYGADDAALVEVLFGEGTPRGRLPFDLPRSMDAVVASRPDVPFDTADPLFRFGDGLVGLP